MAALKLHFYVKNRTPGLRFRELSGFAQTALTFLRALSGPIMTAGSPEAWRASDFKNQSFGTEAIYEGVLAQRTISALKMRAEHNLSFDPDSKQLDDSYDLAVLASVADFSKWIDDKDVFRFGVPNGRKEHWFDFSKPRLVQISEAIRTYEAPAIHAGLEPLPAEITYIGGFQGSIVSLYLDPSEGDPHFWFKEVVTGNRIKCFYAEGDYPKIVKGIEKKDSIIHISGIITGAPISGGNVQCRVTSIERPKEISDIELASLFQSSRN